MASRKPINCRHRSPFQGGFTLVELMVGLAIGMLATLVVMQVFTVFEGQKRTTTGAGDAQTNGNIALYNITRAMTQAGYGLVPTSLPTINSPLRCQNLTIEGALDTSTPNRIFPVAIVNEAGSGGDTIRISFGDSAMGANPTPIFNIGPTATLPTANDVQVGESFGCFPGSRTLVLSQDGASCSLSTASAVVAASGVQPNYVTLANITNAVAGSNLACLGNWRELTYSAINGNLEESGTPIVAGIVNLQAQYGISAAGLSNIAPNFNTVVQWVNADAASGFNTPSVDDRVRIKAVRIAVIARNARKEPKDPVTGTCNITAACSALDTANPTGLCAWAGTPASPAPAVDLSANDPDWACYRYRVFETVIPLRNMIWAREAL